MNGIVTCVTLSYWWESFSSSPLLSSPLVWNELELSLKQESHGMQILQGVTGDTVAECTPRRVLPVVVSQEKICHTDTGTAKDVTSTTGLWPIATLVHGRRHRGYFATGGDTSGGREVQQDVSRQHKC